MTTPPRNRIAPLILALAMAATVPLPRAALAVDGQFEKMRAKIAAFIGDKMEKLGGSRIVYKVDADGLRESALTDLRDDVYKTVREGKIAFSGLVIRDGGVEVKIADAKGREELKRKLAAAAEGLPAHALAVTDGGDGLVRLKPTDAASAAALHDLVEDSIAMIEQRLKDAGIKLASAQPDGTDRIRIFVPGMMEPERVTAIFATKVKVSFRMVDLSMPAEQAQSGTPPASAEVLLGFKDNRPYLVAKDSALDGNDISYAGPGFASSTNEPIATFRFNGRGTRRFAHITEENIGKPFAIVLDGKVLSAPVIREPITGGSGQISGNFTLEEASSVAMLLRAGSLPGRLGLVEQQVIQPAAKP
ncbi:preprotein translocase subunit SecD [Bradyrhizobium sacchari]|uniref:Preprotein translocase subunit SecD n=1 Tax=Bradyrhizobium sacchari TaxID=1399419 RepID=A0A560K4N7_9BRAD|nr:preprotein translocase subunit SecD [Bradyrhizobium sacchari]OPY93952.1 preprotein translocase subunit SecD [Bradyrhizobium sacchari]TWB53857.1 preprotein translocase subunit SecD [Bradyrhizobium sacchari]TWB78305.1 preprotein translocase subunit SecD [Bradyrhizobium sacchari]